MVKINNSLLPLVTTALVASRALASFNAFPFSPGFDIQKVAEKAQSLPSHAWEWGTAAEALLELYNPELSVFSARPFPVPVVNYTEVLALNYAASKVVWGSSFDTFSRNNGAAGDPSSFGVSAVLIGKTNETFAKGADDTVTGLFNDVPRFENGAISHRASVPELWADWMYMVPPFLAYYAIDKGDQQLLQDTITQITLYREILQGNDTATPATNGIWKHIIGPQSQDTGHWSTGNAWAAAGMTRVLAAVTKSYAGPLTPAFHAQAVHLLTGYIKEIIDGAMGASLDDGLVRNYIDDEDNQDGLGFGETSGSALLAGAIYRMAVLQPRVFGAQYVAWADAIRKTLGGRDKDGNVHVTEDGIVTPAVNPLWWKDTNKYTKGSPEGQAFVVMMYTGWRDCVIAGYCPIVSL
ncbi:hypothetical protein CPC08DRAFT_642627 [Agrocybe pediades]|nr:hypothetical protein CPC08DRAFT_642627 [Agrocybe pediades]